jgi:hypothetical protein
MTRRKAKPAAKRKPKAKPKPKTAPRRGVAASVLAGVAALIAWVVVLVARALRPVGPLLAGVAARTWESRTARRLAFVAAGAVVLVGVALVMEHNLRQEPRFVIDPARIELVEEPMWAKGTLARRLKEEIENDLRADLSDLKPTSAFDAEVLEVISTRLKNNPWIHSVERIERRFPTDGSSHSRLLPVLKVRRPVLAIETADRYVLVDGTGVVLPLGVSFGDEFAEFRRNLNGPLRVTRGVSGVAPGPGKVWDNEQVFAALSMERIVRRAKLDNSFPIEAIELVGVPRHADERGRVHYPPDGAVVLVPYTGLFEDARVIWGRPPVHASTLEPSPNDKLDRLRQRLTSPDSISGTNIDLRRRA